MKPPVAHSPRMSQIEAAAAAGFLRAAMPASQLPFRRSTASTSSGLNSVRAWAFAWTSPSDQPGLARRTASMASSIVA
jgi:hypothetical protein